MSISLPLHPLRSETLGAKQVVDALVPVDCVSAEAVAVGERMLVLVPAHVLGVLPSLGPVPVPVLVLVLGFGLLALELVVELGVAGPGVVEVAGVVAVAVLAGILARWHEIAPDRA